ncbi:uncharacterized protein LOC143039513 isoform X2 [Oratosquilla oratoria]|uniref:uncharacterized protein LOC143039513 isoform X2 n=1 Tax=Oratosquilla oratoria TaxID=337810 RepID=UPI003F75F102
MTCSPSGWTLPLRWRCGSPPSSFLLLIVHGPPARHKASSAGRPARPPALARCVEVEPHDPASYLTYTSTFHGNSTCSAAATLRGPNQLVLSTSAVINSPSQAHLFEKSARQAQDLYRGWTLRLYTSTSGSDLNLICPVVCKYPNVDLCTVEKAGLADLSSAEPWGWKWAVMGDPLVSVWETRRLDEALQVRDAHATTQFANAPQCWHVMRDHSGHMRTVGSGMVGGKGSWGLDNAVKLRRQLLSKASTNGDAKERGRTSDPKNKENSDVEVVLGEHLGTTDTMMHDSVACTYAGGASAVSFPSVRPPGTWVGMPQSLSKEEIDPPSRGAPSDRLSGSMEGRTDFKKQARRGDTKGKAFGGDLIKIVKPDHTRNDLDQSLLLKKLEMKVWKDGESLKKWKLKTRNDSSHSNTKGDSNLVNAGTALEENVKNYFTSKRKKLLEPTVIKVPLDILKTSVNHSHDSRQNSSAAGNLRVPHQPSKHPEYSLVLENDRRNGKVASVSQFLPNNTKSSHLIPKNESIHRNLTKPTLVRNDTRMSKIKENTLSPKITRKTIIKSTEEPSMLDNNSHPTGDSLALKKTPKYKRSVDTSAKEFKSIHELHKELGIPPCPEACRPFLHPDWEYC